MKRRHTTDDTETTGTTTRKVRRSVSASSTTSETLGHAGSHARPRSESRLSEVMATEVETWGRGATRGQVDLEKVARLSRRVSGRALLRSCLASD